MNVSRFIPVTVVGVLVCGAGLIRPDTADVLAKSCTVPELSLKYSLPSVMLMASSDPNVLLVRLPAAGAWLAVLLL